MRSGTRCTPTQATSNEIISFAMLSVSEHRKTGARPGNEGLASISSTFEVPLRCASCNVQQMLKNISYQDLQVVNLINNGVNRLAAGWVPEVPSHSRQSTFCIQSRRNKALL